MAATQGGIQRERCIALRQQGYSLRRIAKAIGVSPATVRYHVRAVDADAIADHENRPQPSEPQPLLPSEDLAYLIGIIAGDGCLYPLPRTCQLLIACDAQYPELIERYAQLIAGLVGRRPNIHWRKQGHWVDIKVCHKDFPVMLGLPSGPKSKSGFVVPEWIFGEVQYIARFMRGLLETDGGIYRVHHKKGWFWFCSFTQTNEAVMQGFLRSATELGYPFKRAKNVAKLTNTAEVKRLMQELPMSKIREYLYP